MKISTIVPVYNAEKYLNKCIDSIINQSIGFNNIELILVDDGSIDNSKNIIKEYTDKYKNIIYIYQKNSGQASARNNGLKIAKGEFVSFVDSDDWIDSKMYETLIDKSKNMDIVTCDYSFVENNNYKYVSFRFISDERLNFIIMNTGPCNMIIKRELLMKYNFKFPEGIIYEDLASIPILGIHTKNIVYIEESLYYYNIHDNSTMNNKVYNKKIEDILKSVEILYNSWKKYDKKEVYYSEIEYLFIRRFLMSASLRFIEYNDPNNCIEKISMIVREKFPNWKNNKYYKKLSIKQKIVAILTYKNKKKILHFLYKINNKRKR